MQEKRLELPVFLVHSLHSEFDTLDLSGLMKALKEPCPHVFFKKVLLRQLFFFSVLKWFERMDRLSWPNLAFQAAGGRILSHLISRILGLSEPWGLREVYKKNLCHMHEQLSHKQISHNRLFLFMRT